MIDAEKGQTIYRFGNLSAMGTYYREMKVIRVTPKQIVAQSKMRQEYRFWRRNGREVGSGIGYMGLELPQGKCHEAGCDRGREWPNG